MSDFGTIISAIKKDEADFSEEEIAGLSEKLAAIIGDDMYTDTMGEPFSANFNRTSKSSLVIVQLSEHYYGGDPIEDKELLEFVEDTELELAQEIVEALSEAFPEITFTAETTEW
ncbi:hypothetical protein [Flavobacterium sp.]|uniref:hypothetical protein n=1 Tax=Flavobacterium sp. TaxID=239 RepID=UPI0039E2C8F0